MRLVVVKVERCGLPAIVEILDAQAEARHAQLRIASSFASLSVPGSHSNVISSAVFHVETDVSRDTSPVS